MTFRKLNQFPYSGDGKRTTVLGPLERTRVIEIKYFYGAQQIRCLLSVILRRKQVRLPKRRVFWYLEFRTTDTVQRRSDSEFSHELDTPTADSGLTKPVHGLPATGCSLPSLAVKSESNPELLHDWRFTAIQFILAPSPLRLTSRDFFHQLNPCSHIPYVTPSRQRQ
jgi:hypothetical protein